MIQFNLLPDVKLEYIKAKRTKRLVILSSIVVAGSLLGITILLFLAVSVFQSNHLKDLNKDIASKSKELKDTPDLNKILTIQNQLNSLPALHDSKPVTSRLFGYLSQTTPQQLTIAKLDVVFGEENTMKFTGGADSLSTINKFVDTLKFTTFQDGEEKSDAKAFSSVVLTTFGRDEKGATYTIDLKFDKSIFDSSKKIKLVVPKITSTRSETEKPADLFQPGGSEQLNTGQ